METRKEGMEEDIKTTPKLEFYVIRNSTMMSTDNGTRSFTKAVNALIVDPFLEFPCKSYLPLIIFKFRCALPAHPQ